MTLHLKDHSSTKIIKEIVSTTSLFHLTEISVSEMTKELSNLNSKKAVTFGNIPTKVLKISSDICRYPLIFASKNMEFRNFKETFPQNLKLADIIPIFKKKDPTLAENYRPVSVLSTVSKLFE